MKKILKSLLLLTLCVFMVIGLGACNTCVHDWEVETVEGTCMVKGTKSKECKKCGEVETETLDYGPHYTKWAFDNEKHWKENTCEHEFTPDKKDHVLVNGVCECGYKQVTIESVINDFNNTVVLQDGVNVKLVLTTYYYNENYAPFEEFSLNFKDNCFFGPDLDSYMGDEEHMSLIADEDWVYLCESSGWQKVTSQIFNEKIFNNEKPTLNKFIKLFAKVEDDLFKGTVGFVSLGNDKWKKEFTEDYYVIVTVEDGKLALAEYYSSGGRIEEKLTVTYGDADVSLMPEIDKSTVVDVTPNNS